MSKQSAYCKVTAVRLRGFIHRNSTVLVPDLEQIGFESLSATFDSTDAYIDNVGLKIYGLSIAGIVALRVRRQKSIALRSWS
jgi:hypothetical protein